MITIHHVTLLVDDIEASTNFYLKYFGFERIKVEGLDYPGSFLRINETQELHLAELPDQPPSFRGHFCLRIDDFMERFYQFQGLGLLDTKPWGKLRELPNGSIQMYIRDPAGNLIELTSHPEDLAAIDEQLYKQPEWGGTPYSYLKD